MVLCVERAILCISLEEAPHFSLLVASRTWTSMGSYAEFLLQKELGQQRGECDMVLDNEEP